jgi:hypothetical protein
MAQPARKLPPFGAPEAPDPFRYGSRWRRVRLPIGLLLSETTGLRFGAESDGETLRIVDAQTGERLLDPDDQILRESAAREAAEKRAQEAEAELAPSPRRAGAP